MNTSKIETITFQKYVAQLQIDPQFYISCMKYPNWFHRTMVKLMFGWTYKRSV